MRPTDVSNLLAAMIKARHPVLLVGAPGVGKSDLVDQATAEAKATLLTSHPVVDDPTSAGGYPWLQSGKDHAEHIPYGELYQALNAKKPTVWFLDDLGQAPPAVQASYMQLLLNRSSKGRKLPDCVTFIAATNRRTDRAGVSGVLEPVKSRFVTIIEVEPNLDDWREWAIKTDQPPEVIAFLGLRPGLLSNFTPTLDLVNSPSPRTWASVGKILRLGLSPRVELAAIMGAVGHGAAEEFVGFLKIRREMPSLDAILADPDGSEIPTAAGVLYAIAVGLAQRSTEENFENVVRYAEKLRANGKGDFAVLTIRNATRRNKKLCSTAAYIKLASSDIGKQFLGEEVA